MIYAHGVRQQEPLGPREGVAYVTICDEDGQRVCHLVDENGDLIASSIYGQTPLIMFAADHYMRICSVH